jgi:formylmethanofuran dehydrogenase subunit E
MFMERDVDTDEPDATPEPTIVCEMCRRPVPERHTTLITGRRLCFGCAAAWFEGDEND